MKGVDGMGKIPRDSWAIIERVIRRYPESKKEYEDIYKDLIGARSESLFTCIILSNDVGKPTEKAALKLTCPKIERLHREIEAVETVYNESIPEHQEVVKVRFWSDRSRNMPYLQMEKLVNYKEGQMKRISHEFVKNVGKKIGEI